jgi:ankyrin repeat protein
MAILQVLLDASNVPVTLSESFYKQEQANHRLKHKSKKNRRDYPHINNAKKCVCGHMDNLSSNTINIDATCQENTEVVRKQCSVSTSPDLELDSAVTDLSNPSGQKQNLGYFIVVHKDKSVLHSPISMENENLKQAVDENWNQGMTECASSCAGVQNNETTACALNDDRTPDGMDGLEWDVEVEDNGRGSEGEEEEDSWASLYRWYADILDRTSSLLQLPHRCDVNHQDVYGRCAVHYAAEQGHVDALHLLTAAGNQVSHLGMQLSNIL